MPWSETTYWENTLLVSILSFWMRLVGSSRLISIKRRGRQTLQLSLRRVANSDYPPRSNDRVPATAAMFGYFLTVGFRHVRREVHFRDGGIAASRGVSRSL